MTHICDYCGVDFLPASTRSTCCSIRCTKARCMARRRATDPDYVKATRTYLRNYMRDAETAERRQAYLRQYKQERRKSDPAFRERENLNDRTRYQIAVYGSPTPDPLTMTHDRFRRARALGYRSGLEVTVANSLTARGMDFDYEQHTLPYNVPARKARSTPDFVLENGIVVETKGLWDSDDRKKVALIREQYPDLDFRMVFNNPNAKISKTSKTSYADICVKLGIPFATKDIPSAWLKEPRNEKSIAILESISK